MRKRRVKYRRRCKQRRCKKRRRSQRGGIFPLLAMAIPAAIAAGKAAALGAIGTGAGAAVNAIANKIRRRKK